MEQIVADRYNKACYGGTLGPRKRPPDHTNPLTSRRLFVLPFKKDNNNSNDGVSGGNNVIQRPHKMARVDDKENVDNGSGGDVNNDNSITSALTDTICTTPTTHRYAAESDDEDSFTATNTTSTTPIVRHRFINSLVEVTTIQACIQRFIVRH